MKLFLLGALLLFTGCATKYMLPGNRFITPETQGEAFRGQMEIQKTSGTEVSIDTKNNTVDEGVLYNTVSRSGFLFSNSFFDRFDLVWSETSSANSMIGGKFQFLGGSRVSKSVGHKLALAALVGSNEHETDDKLVTFTLGGSEYMLLYGYRFLPEIMMYSSLSQANYNFKGQIHGSGALSGQRPNINSQILSVSGGLEGNIDIVFAKLELTYQSIMSSKTNYYSHYITGLSIGLQW
ncbi:MAG: hypothetical protein ACJ76H_01325 [Bacteriovoracaceae bacterium]